jgi:hypothetical protein
MKYITSGGWKESKEAALELLQFTSEQFGSFLALLTLHMSEAFAGPYHGKYIISIEAKCHSKLIEQVLADAGHPLPVYEFLVHAFYSGPTRAPVRIRYHGTQTPIPFTFGREK